MSEQELAGEEVGLADPIPGELSGPPGPSEGLGGSENVLPEDVLPGEAAVNRAARRSLDGHTRGIPRIWPFLGPAFIAAVAYIDPGNFATNIAGGAKFGYLLLWVVLGANLIAMVVQTQSAKLGIATGRNLAEACRDSFSRRTSIGLWLQAEVVAAACDVAEGVGAALGLNLLFGIPLFPAGLLAGAGAFAILGLQQKGFRRLEAVIVGMGGVVVLAFAFEGFESHPDGGQVGTHLFPPGFAGAESILLATGIIGATVMPHVIYLHSALTQRRIVGRNEREKRQILRFERVDVVIAMALAGAVNLAMMIMAAALFHNSGLAGIDTIDGAYDGLKQLVSPSAATIFGIALLASGYASSSWGPCRARSSCRASSGGESRSSSAARSRWRPRCSSWRLGSIPPMLWSAARLSSPSASRSRSCRW